MAPPKKSKKSKKGSKKLKECKRASVVPIEPKATETDWWDSFWHKNSSAPGFFFLTWVCSLMGENPFFFFLSAFCLTMSSKGDIVNSLCSIMIFIILLSCSC
ncbi:Nuclease [Quillaja saponaria]|uniref:Nuclease n=1 Tax=Quillaja saponaria TaxID=32244 RepID=A0AAD7Q9F3_QUISA|nr:Nuclease [Quillaja saponaria]